MVVGPNGVFIIENKSYRGWVKGDWNSDQWELYKIGRCGTPYINSCRNPARQVQVYVSLLAGIFSRRDIKAWITPMVSLSRNNSLGLINSEKVQVMRVADLCERIQAHHGATVEGEHGQGARSPEELGGRLEDEGTIDVVNPCTESPE